MGFGPTQAAGKQPPWLRGQGKRRKLRSFNRLTYIFPGNNSREGPQYYASVTDSDVEPGVRKIAGSGRRRRPPPDPGPHPRGSRCGRPAGFDGLHPGGPWPGRAPGTKERRGRPGNPGRPGRPGTIENRGSHSHRHAPRPCADRNGSDRSGPGSWSAATIARVFGYYGRTPGLRRGLTSPRTKPGAAASTPEISCLSEARSSCPMPFLLVGLLRDVLQLSAEQELLVLTILEIKG